MATGASPLLLSVEDYLRHEADGAVRHEYIGGRVLPLARLYEGVL